MANGETLVNTQWACGALLEAISRSNEAVKFAFELYALAYRVALGIMSMWKQLFSEAPAGAMECVCGL